MNFSCVSVLIGFLMVVAVSGAPKTFEENVATLKKVDMKAVLQNKRIMRSYVDCVVHNTHCTPESIALKESWKEGLDQGCADPCDEEAKKRVQIIAKYVYTEQPEWYKEIIEALDKDKKYRTKYQEDIDRILNDPTIEIPK